MKVKEIIHACGRCLGILAALSTGCALGTPAARFEAAAESAGLSAGEIAGAGFRHRTFTADPTAGGSTLFVYFGGDGTPFVRPDTVARDPTPRRPLTLDLLRRGPAPAVFLGRPCYHGLTERCHPGLWTVGRYSEPVVASMTAATRRLIESGGHERAVLIGYSGGGVLALLVAERLRRVDAVVTLAANLDIDAWGGLHGYSPLTTSINPVTAAGTRHDLVHLHLSGDADRNVPPPVHGRLHDKLAHGAFRTLAGFDHRCCWVQAWPRLAAELQRRLSESAQAPPQPAHER